MARVLKLGGRLLVVDSNLELLPSFEGEGFSQVKAGEIPFGGDYNYILWKSIKPRVLDGTKKLLEG